MRIHTFLPLLVAALAQVNADCVAVYDHCKHDACFEDLRDPLWERQALEDCKEFLVSTVTPAATTVTKTYTQHGVTTDDVGSTLVVVQETTQTNEVLVQTTETVDATVTETDDITVTSSRGETATDVIAATETSTRSDLATSVDEVEATTTVDVDASTTIDATETLTTTIATTQVIIYTSTITTVLATTVEEGVTYYPTTTITITVTTTSVPGAGLTFRRRGAAPSSRVLQYCPHCPGLPDFSSACSCLGVIPTTVTLSTPVKTVAVYQTIDATVTRDVYSTETSFSTDSIDQTRVDSTKSIFVTDATATVSTIDATDVITYTSATETDYTTVSTVELDVTYSTTLVQSTVSTATIPSTTSTETIYATDATIIISDVSTTIVSSADATSTVTSYSTTVTDTTTVDTETLSDTTTATTTTISTSTSSIFTGTCLPTPTFKAVATQAQNTPYYLFDNQPVPSPFGTTVWSPYSAANAVKFTFAFDTDGHLFLAGKLPPFTTQIYYVFVDLNSSLNSLFPQIALQASIAAGVAAGGVAYVTGCVNSITGALTLSAAGRSEILWCGSELWMSNNGGSDVTGRQCVEMFPIAS